MKIFINSIPEEGLNVEEVRDAKELDLETKEIKFVLPLQIRAFISRDKENVFADIDVESKMSMQCVRCLNTFSVPYSKHAMLNFPIEGQHSIEIDEDLRQEIILDYPIVPLCKPDCKGLCPKCGKDLNEGPCSCGKRSF